MRFYEVRPTHYKVSIQDGRRWGLPGVHCPTCAATWTSVGLSWPSIDLSAHPDAAKLTPRLEKDFNEFIRLREAVRPLVPSGVELKPGTDFGPAIGPAKGTKFGALTMGFPWMMLARPEGVAFLKAEGVRGVKAAFTELKFKGKPQEILELQIEPFGRVHPDCLPPNPPRPCATCGRRGLVLPDPILLDLASLPTDRDIFRLTDFGQVIVVTDRFVEAAKRLGCDDLAFVELPGR